MRHTEARLTLLAMEMREIDERQSISSNYDGRVQSTVLPSGFPTCWPTGQARHRGRHGNQYPAAQPA